MSQRNISQKHEFFGLIINKIINMFIHLYVIVLYYTSSANMFYLIARQVAL